MNLVVVGIGPGKESGMTLEAREALLAADLIVGYDRYVELVRAWLPDKAYYTTSMRAERQRVAYAVERAAEGMHTALVCSGDAGVYGMASLVWEVTEEKALLEQVEIQVIPGVTAALSGSALAGSPFSCDFAVVSLSDLMLPWELIEQRLAGAAQGGFPLAIYNPGSRKRTGHLKRACEILLQYRSPDTICAIAENIGRAGEACRILSLGELAETSVGMTTTVLIGNEYTRLIGGRMVTPRGYAGQYRDGQADPAKTDHKENNTGSSTNSKESLSERPGDEAGDRLLLFGGTSEGRKLAAFALSQGYAVTVSVATAYGEELLQDLEASAQDGDDGGSVNAPASRLEILRGPMPRPEMVERMRSGGYRCVIDATHPYAARITESIRWAAGEAGLPRYRVLRSLADSGREAVPPRKAAGTASDSVAATQTEPGGQGCPAPAAPQGTARVAAHGNLAAPADQAIRYFATMDDIIDYLDARDGRVFFATGSGHAETYARLRRAKERSLIRILPSEQAIAKCKAAGFAGANLLCMQGPFTVGANEACFRYAEADFLVTKASGEAGGYDEKIEAARALGMKILVLAPPEEGAGLSLREMEERLKAWKNGSAS